MIDTMCIGPHMWNGADEQRDGVTKRSNKDGVTTWMSLICVTIPIIGLHFTNYTMHNGLWPNGPIDDNSLILYNSI